MRSTKLRRQGNGGTGDDPQARLARREAKQADTPTTVGYLIIDITGEASEPSTVMVAGRTGKVSRHDPGDSMPHGLQTQMAFVYESERQRGLPGCFTAMDREVCYNEGLGDTLFISEEGKEIRNALWRHGAEECRWVSTEERLNRQPSLW